MEKFALRSVDPGKCQTDDGRDQRFTKARAKVFPADNVQLFGQREVLFIVLNPTDSFQG